VNYIRSSKATYKEYYPKAAKENNDKYFRD